MKVSNEELLHIAKLAHIKIEPNEEDEYLKNLEDILEFADTINNADTSKIEDGEISQNYNVFRKDEPQVFEDNESLLSNSGETERNMFKIPKTVN